MSYLQTAMDMADNLSGVFSRLEITNINWETTAKCVHVVFTDSRDNERHHSAPMKSLIAFAEERNVSIEELDEVDMKSFIRHQNWA
jgi:hypothetical protein